MSLVAMETDHVMREVSVNQPLPKRDKLEKVKRKMKEAYERNVRRKISKSSSDWSRGKYQSSKVKSRDRPNGMDNQGYNFSVGCDVSPCISPVRPGESCFSRELVDYGSTRGPMTDGSTRELMTDGSARELTPDGSTRELTQDGSTRELTQDGSTRELTQDGSTRELTQDGSTRELTQDGSTRELTQDGSTRELTQDGSTRELTPDGSTRELTPDGSTRKPIADGSTRQMTPAGSIRELMTDRSSRDLANAAAPAASTPPLHRSVSETTDSPFDRQQATRRNVVRQGRSRPSMRRYRGSCRLTATRSSNKENQDSRSPPDYVAKENQDSRSPPDYVAKENQDSRSPPDYVAKENQDSRSPPDYVAKENQDSRSPPDYVAKENQDSRSPPDYVADSLIIQSENFKFQSQQEISIEVKNLEGNHSCGPAVSCVNEQARYSANNAWFHKPTFRPSVAPPDQVLVNSTANRPDQTQDITQDTSTEDTEDTGSVFLDFTKLRVKFKKSVSDSSLLVGNRGGRSSARRPEARVDCNLSGVRAENAKRKRSETGESDERSRPRVDFVKRNRELISRLENVKMLRSLSSRLATRSKTDVDKVATTKPVADDEDKKSKLQPRNKSTSNQKVKPVENGTPETVKVESKWDSLSRGTPVRSSIRDKDRRPSGDVIKVPVRVSSTSSSTSSSSSSATSSRSGSTSTPARVVSPRTTPSTAVTPKFQRHGLRGSGSRDRSGDVRSSDVRSAVTSTVRRPSDPSRMTPPQSTPRRAPEKPMVTRRPPTSPSHPATPGKLDIRGTTIDRRAVRSPVPKKTVAKQPDEPHIEEDKALIVNPDPGLTASEEDVSEFKTYLGVPVRRRWPQGRQLSSRPKSLSSQNIDDAGQSSPGMIEKRHSSGVEFRVDLSAPVTRTQSTGVVDGKLRVSDPRTDSTCSSGDYSRGDSGLDSDLSPSATSDVTNDYSSVTPARAVTSVQSSDSQGDLTPTNRRASWAQSLDNSQVFEEESAGSQVEKDSGNKSDTVDGRSELVKSSIPVTGSLRRTASVRIKTVTDERPGLRRSNSLNKGMARPNLRQPGDEVGRPRPTGDEVGKEVEASAEFKRKMTSPNRIVSAAKRTRAVPADTKPAVTKPMTESGSVASSVTSGSVASSVTSGSVASSVTFGSVASSVTSRLTAPSKLSRLPRTPSLDRMTRTERSVSNTNLRRAPSTEKLRRTPSIDSHRSPLASSKKPQEPLTKTTSPKSDAASSDPRNTTTSKTPAVTSPPRKDVSKSTALKSSSSPQSSLPTSPRSGIMTSSKTDTVTSPKTVTVTSPKTVTVTSPKTVTVTSPKTDATTSPKAATVTSSKSDIVTSQKTDTETSPRSGIMTSSKSDTVTSPRSGIMTSSRAATSTSPRSGTVTSPKTDTVTSPKTDTVTSPKTDTVTSPKTDTVTSPKTDTVTSPKSEAMTSPKTDAVTSPKTDTVTSPRPDTVTSQRHGTLTSPDVVTGPDTLVKTPQKTVADLTGTPRRVPRADTVLKPGVENGQVKRSRSMEKIGIRNVRKAEVPPISPLAVRKVEVPPITPLAAVKQSSEPKQPLVKPGPSIADAVSDAANAQLDATSQSLQATPDYSATAGKPRTTRELSIVTASIFSNHSSPVAVPIRTPPRPVSVDRCESDVTTVRHSTTPSPPVRSRDSDVRSRLHEVRRDSLGSNGQSVHSSERLSSETSVFTSGSVSERSEPDVSRRLSSSEGDEVFAAQSWHYRNAKKRTSPGRLVSDSGLIHFEMETDEPLQEAASEEDSSDGDECVRITVKASPPQPLQFTAKVESNESIYTVSSEGAWNHVPTTVPSEEMEEAFYAEVSTSGAWSRRQSGAKSSLGLCSIDTPTVVEAVSRTPSHRDTDYEDQFYNDNFMVRRGLAMHGNVPYHSNHSDRRGGAASYRADRYREESPREGGGEAPMFEDSMLKETQSGQYVRSTRPETIVPSDLVQTSRLSALETDVPTRAHRRTLSDDLAPDNGVRHTHDKKGGMGSLFRSKSLRHPPKGEGHVTRSESDSTSTSTDENREVKRLHFIRKVFSTKRRKDVNKSDVDVTPRGTSPLDHNQNSNDDVTPCRTDDAAEEENEHDVTLTEEVETRKAMRHKSPSFIEEEDGLVRFAMSDEGSYTNFALSEPDDRDEITPLPTVGSPRALSPVDYHSDHSSTTADSTPVRKFSDGVSVGIAGLNMPDRVKSPTRFDSSDLSFPYGGPRQTRSHTEMSPGGRVKLSRTESFRVGKKPEEVGGDFKRGAIYRGSGTMKRMVALIRPEVVKDPAVGLNLDYIKSTLQRRQSAQNKETNSSSSGDQDVTDGCHSDTNTGCHSDSGLGNDVLLGRDSGSSQRTSVQDIVDLSRKADIESLRNILSSVPVRYRNRNSRLLDRPKSDNFDSLASGTGSDTLDSGTGSLRRREQTKRGEDRPVSYGGQSTVSDASGRVRLSPSQMSLSSDASSQETIARINRSRTFSAPRPIKLRKKRTPEVRRSQTVRSSTSAPDLVALLRNSTKLAPGSCSTDASSMYLSNLQLTDTDEINYNYDTMSLGSCASSQSNVEVFNEEVVMLAEAVWDHVTMDLDELPFRAGQVIQVTDMMDRDWWWGLLNDRHGWFPSQFVRPLVNQSPLMESVADDRLTNRLSADVQKLGDVTGTSKSRDQARSNVVREIISAETEYVKNLRYVNEGYKYHAEKRPELFTPEQINIMFGNIDEILSFSQEFLRLLEENIDTERPHKSRIGRCFLDVKEGFEIYSSYCNNHPLASAELQKLRQNPQHAQFFEACRLLQDKSMLPLEGFLLTPVQKICKYPLQLAELLKYTSKNTETDDVALDYADIADAVSSMKEIAQLINENKRLVESVEKIAVWQTTIQNWQGPDVLNESTVLVHTGELNKTSLNSGWPRDRVFFLFDHQLIYCKKDLLRKDLFTYKGRIQTDECEIIPVEDGKDNQFNVTVRHAWKVIDNRKNKCYLLAARSQTDKDRWLQALQEERTKVEAGFEEKAVSQAKKLAAQSLKTRMHEERQVNANAKARVGRSASIRHPSQRQQNVTTPSSSIPVTSTSTSSLKSSESKKSSRNWSFFGARKVHR